jgi:hypothetical protein
MENERSGFTEAQAQIERLKKLKEQKDLSDKVKKEEEFRFAELPHAVTNPPKHNAPWVNDDTPPEAIIKHASSPDLNGAQAVKALKVKKTQRASRLDRRNYDRIKKTVRNIKEAGPSMRLSEDMFVNMALEKILDLKMDFSQAKTSEEVRAIINKIKAE